MPFLLESAPETKGKNKVHEVSACEKKEGPSVGGGGKRSNSGGLNEGRDVYTEARDRGGGSGSLFSYTRGVWEENVGGREDTRAVIADDDFASRGRERERDGGEKVGPSDEVTGAEYGRKERAREEAA